MARNSAISPGRVGVTFESTSAVADSIVATGDRPTLRSVRSILGTGSLSTVSKHLTKWHDERRPATVHTIELPQSVQRVLLDEIARQIASASLENARELDEAKSARDALVDESQQFASELDGANKQISELETALATQAGVLEQLKADTAVAAERERDSAGRAERFTRDLARAELRLEAVPRIEADLADARGQLETEWELRGVLEQKVARLEATGSSADAQLKQVIAQLATIAEKAAVLEKSEREFEAREREALVKLDAASRRAQDSEVRLQAAEVSAKRLLDQILLANQQPQAK